MARRVVTIYTDASLDGQKRCAGWGCWIKADGEPGIQIYGSLRGEVRSTTAAELAAIANGLAVAQRRVGIAAGDMVVVVTDSQMARRCLTAGVRWRRGKKTPANIELINRAVAAVREIEAATGCLVRVNHVKSHSTHDGTRSSVNALVDRLAKMGLRAAREKVAA